MTNFTELKKKFVANKRDNASHKTPIYRTDIMGEMYEIIKINSTKKESLARSPNSHNISYDNNQISCDINYAGNSTTSTNSTPTSWSFPSSGSYVGYGSEGVFQ
jgi:hypothetical protein